MSRFSEIKVLAFQLLPKPFQTKILSYVEDKRIKYWQECFKTKVSQQQVYELFSKMAIDCDVMIHSSLPDIGNIKLKHVTDALKDSVLDKGHTVLCPALPVKGSTLEYLKTITEFDVRSAPNAMGSISCYFGRQTDAVRSMSPTHSVVAEGPKASYYVSEHHLSETPFTEKSPYYKLIENKGKILMFGASLNHLTFNHVLEDMIGEELFPVKVYDSARFEIELINESGEKSRGIFRTHSHKNGRLRDSKEAMKLVRSLPSTKVYSLGCGEVLLLDARDVIVCLLSSLKKGITTMGRRHTSAKCQQKADLMIRAIQQL